MQLSLFTVVPMILVLASASAESHLRGLQAKKCSDYGSTPEYGGDCSETPTYCGRGWGTRPPTQDPPSPFPQDPQPPAQEPRPPIDDFWNNSRESCNACGGFWPTTQPANCHDRYNQDLTMCGSPLGTPTSSPTASPTSDVDPKTSSPTSSPFPPGNNVVSCSYRGPDNRYFEDDIPVEYSDEARTCFDRSSYEWMGQYLTNQCSPGVYEEVPQWCSSNYLGRFGGYRGSCSGTNNCLNLDFHCAEGEYCEMSCTGKDSCEGLTMHCADNQVCLLKCGSPFGDSCVDAEVKCGEGTVAQSDGKNQGCVLVDTADDCDKSILPLYTKSPTSTPTTSPTEPFILTPIISYTCVGVTCSDGSDGSTCGSDGGCCPFRDTPSDGQCSCGTSWSDANMNQIPCKLTQQQPETASPTSSPPTSESEPETASPTSNQTTLPIGSGCCSRNFRTCDSDGGDSKESCELLGSMIWLENGDLPQQCLEQDSTCSDDIDACCPGLTCDGDQWYKQCKFMPNSSK